MVDASCVQIKPGGISGGNLEDNCMTLHHTIWPARESLIINYCLLNPPEFPHWHVGHKPVGKLRGIWKTMAVGYYHGITKLLNTIFYFKTYLFTYILYMKQSSGFVELHNGPPWSKKFVPLRILIRFGRSPKGLLTPLDRRLTVSIRYLYNYKCRDCAT